MQISKEELQSSSIPLAKALEEYLQHHLDIITDSDWFAELVEEKINKMGVSSNGKTSSSNLEDVGSIPTTSAKKIEGDKMGRYYNGDIEGKFWFAVQSSNDADYFGVEGDARFLNYYFTEEDLPKIEADQEMQTIFRLTFRNTK